MTEQAITDSILRTALELQRVSAYEESRADEVLRQLTEELRQLLYSADLSAAGKREVEALIKEAESAIQARYGAIYGMFDAQGLTVHVAERTVEALQAGFGDGINAPTLNALTGRSRNLMVHGLHLKKVLDNHSLHVRDAFESAINQGRANGETQEQIVARVVGARARPGIMNVARNNARALVHSAVMSAANEARMAVYRKNARFIDGVRWLSTLDSHTCMTCAALDGQAWSLEGDKLKGTIKPLEFPPQHFNCRCVMTPVPKSLDSIFGRDDLDDFAASLSRRASSQGPVAGTTTFADFLKRQSPEFVAQTLGKTRAELYLAGKLTLRDLVSGTGRPLTLDELRTR